MTLSEAYRKLAKSFKNGVYLEPVDKTNWKQGGEFYLTKEGNVFGMFSVGGVSKPSHYQFIQESMRQLGVKNDFRLTSTL